MSNQTANEYTILLQEGYQLTLTADAFTSGYYFVIGNPGSAPSALSNITPNTSTLVGPFNYPMQYALVSVTGLIKYSQTYDAINTSSEQLAGLTDVNLTDLITDDILSYNGTDWVNTFSTPGSGATKLNELSDVSVTTPAARQTILYNAGTSKFTNRLIVEADVSDLKSYLVDISTQSIDGLDDVTIVTPATYDVLAYNGTIWTNETYSTVGRTGAYADLTGKPSLATVALTGSYSDLTGKPSLATVATSGAYSDLTGKPSLATVATSGLYTDLSGAPTISGTNTGDQLVFKTFAVSGQTSVNPTTTTDTLTLVAGTNTTITTSGKNITINSTGSGGGGTMSHLSDDTSPTLGGNLSLSTFHITGLQIGTDVQAYNAGLTNLATTWTVNTTSVGNNLKFFEGTTNGTNKLTLQGPANITSDFTVNLPTVAGTILTDAQFATVATTGAYSDLTGKPSLATVATSGSYTDLTSKPTIPTTVAGLTGDVSITSPASNNLLQYNSGTSKWTNVTLSGAGFATVATTGAYSDLTGKPTIPTTVAALTGDVNITSPVNLNILQYNSASSKWLNQTISGAGFATVATTGAYTDLSGKPTLGTLAAQNGTFSGTSSGTNTGDQNTFSSYAVSGQTSISPSTTTDTLTFVAGTNITLTTSGKNLTINSSGGGGSGMSVAAAYGYNNLW